MILSIVSLFSTSFVGAQATVDTVVVSNSLDAERTQWARTIDLPKFDPALGTLTSATFVIESDLNGSAGYENLEPFQATVELILAARVELSLPGRATPVAVASPQFRFEEDAGSFDGGIDFAGTSGQFFLGLNTTAASVPTVLPAADLQGFIGRVGQQDTIELSISATGQSEGSGPANLATTFLSNAGATVTITYEYEPFTPAIELEKRTNGADANDPNGADVPQIAVGEAVVWEFAVTNSGDSTFAFNDVDIADDQNVVPEFVASSDADGDGLLLPGETWIYRAEGVAENLETTTASTVDGCNPSGSGIPRSAYRNEATVTTSTASASDVSHYCNPLPATPTFTPTNTPTPEPTPTFTPTNTPTNTPTPTFTPTTVPMPGLRVEKSADGQSGQNPNDADVPVFAAGEQIEWRYLVSNTGNVPFTKNQLTITDDQGVDPQLVTATDTGRDNVLSPGETWRFIGTEQARDLSANSGAFGVVLGCDPSATGDLRPALRNIVTVRSGTTTATDQSHYCNPPTPAIDIEKRTNGVDADQPIGPSGSTIVVDSEVRWDYVVRNNGDLSLSNLQVMDDNGTPANSADDMLPSYVSGDSNGDGKLNVDEVWRYEAIGAANVGAYGNVGSVSARYAAAHGLAMGGTVRDTDRSHYYACVVDFGFERDSEGAALSPGQIIDGEWSRHGIQVTTNDPANHAAMIFDSANPTGQDWDLGTPNQDFGGPGVGVGGGQGNVGLNDTALGNVLIISKDNLSNAPNDHNQGGSIFFNFDTPMPVTEMQILDIDGDEPGGLVKAYDAAGALIRSVPLLPMGNNSVQTVRVQAQDVSQLEVSFLSSGALAGLTFCP